MLFMHKNIPHQVVVFIGNDNEEVVDKLIISWSNKEADMTKQERARKNAVYRIRDTFVDTS